MGFFKNLIDGISGKAAKDAAKAQVEGLQAGNARLDEVLARITPQIDAGDDALNRLRAFMGLDGQPEAFQANNALFEDPAFMAAQDFANRQTLADASAAGIRNSGSTLAALRDRSANDAFGFRSQHLNRLMQLSGFGQNATAQFGNVTNRVANNLIGMGQARAQGEIGSSNAATGFTNQLIQLAGKVASMGMGGP